MIEFLYLNKVCFLKALFWKIIYILCVVDVIVGDDLRYFLRFLEIIYEVLKRNSIIVIK